MIGVSLPFSIWSLEAVLCKNDDGRAEWDTARMVIAHLEENDGAWPQNWEALRPQYESGSGWSFSFWQYPRRIVVDFESNTEELRKQSLASSDATFNVIYERYETYIVVDEDPNTMLWGHFQNQ